MAESGVPEGWRGSNLRTRTEVVQYLAGLGGTLEDKHGGAGKQLETILGHGRGFAQTLRGMEADGMIRREVKGRRTYKIELVDGWGLDDRPAATAPVSGQRQTRSDNEMPEGVDYEELAETLLRAVVAKATAPAPGSREVREAAARAEKAEREQRQLEAKLRETNEAKRMSEAERDEAREQARVLAANLETLRAELASPGRRRGTTTVAERLTPEAKKALEQLAERLPSKRRTQAG